ncbi:MAG: hypothetical protein Q7R66_09745 [Undibacterium sp.]|uniref:hypothetical protein n=1 Tax=Undibacterium sp. TaxID=1914977 RepID=UPI0027161AB6|nr:hypothetical protein [Undibacterium sp.]MDO8652460.1 hypothetical protein [Undibacterium sp.]
MKSIGPRRLPSKRTGGPRTKEGKVAVAANAMTHGVNTALMVIPGEDASEFEQLFQSMAGDFSPQGTAETLLVHRISHLISKQRRLGKFERDQVPYGEKSAVRARRLTSAWNLECSHRWRALPKNKMLSALNELRVMHSCRASLQPAIVVCNPKAAIK